MPDGAHLVTGSFDKLLLTDFGTYTGDKTAKVWDARTGTLVLQLKGHIRGVSSVAYSPDATRLITGSDDNTAKVWDARTGTLLLDLKGHTGGLMSVAFSPDGTRIVTGSFDKTAKVWDAEIGKELPEEVKNLKLRPGATSADGRYFAYGDRNHVRIIDLVLTAEERAYRQFWTGPRPDFHREEYFRALQAEDTFAARFHLDRLGPRDGQFHARVGAILRQKKDLEGALAAYRQAIGLDPRDAQLHVEVGAILQENQDLEGAIAAYRLAIELEPKLIESHKKLANALVDKNDVDAALVSYRQALALDPKDTNIYSYLAMQRLYLGGARLYGAAFTDDPKLADDVKAWHRYNAACCAALTAGGQGKDAERLDEQERSRWRKQALDWLRADLAAHEKQVASAQPGDRAFVARRLREWRSDANLAGLRDSEALAKLSAEDRQVCRQLWADVDALLQKSAVDGVLKSLDTRLRKTELTYWSFMRKNPKSNQIWH